MKDRIKQIRKAHKKTQASFAESLNVSKSTIEAIEYGRRDATDRIIADICRVFSINEEWLRTGEGEMKKPLSSEAEKAVISAQVFKEDESSFRFQLMKAISAMPDEGLEMAYHFMEELVDNVRNKKGT